MKQLTQALGAMAFALFTTLVAMVVPMGSALAAPRVISNVATVSWELGATTVTQSSNRVDLEVQVPVEVIAMKTYRLMPGASQTAALGGSTCHGQQGQSSFGFQGVYDGINAASAPIVPTEEIRAGEPLVIEIERPSANHDANAIETVTVVIRTTEGDTETLDLRESGPNSGHFFGIIATTASPPPGTSGDCLLSVLPGDTLTLSALDAPESSAFASSQLDVLLDPYGIIFNSANGLPVDGAKVTIVEAASGTPAEVFGDDGVSPFPSTVTSGGSATDSNGRVYTFPSGEYRFPMMRPGQYRLIIEPPEPFIAPSTVPPEEIARLARPGGGSFVINAASYGGIIALAAPLPFQIDVPVDEPATAIHVAKTASVTVAERGDTVQYRVTVSNPSATRATGAITLTDLLPPQMRLRNGTVRVDGTKVTPAVSSDGSRLSIALPRLGASASVVITYLLEVRPDARVGDAVNRAQASDSRGVQSNLADAAVRIRSDMLSGRMTIIGRVIDGDCGAIGPEAKGIAGVRLMLEDGSYAVSDVEGRYHFEGLLPGTHVVQLDDQTLPADRAAVDCARDTRSGGRAFSRFVEGAGGALKRVDFHAAASAPRGDPAAVTTSRPRPLADPAAAGAERDWFAGLTPGIDWLFPEADHNPRAPVIRVAIKHGAGQTVKLLADGKPVDAIAFDGTRKSGDGAMAVSLWRGIPLTGRDTMLVAEVRDANGVLIETLRRKVHFAASPMQATLIREKSRLIADGVTRPVIALRLLDRDGRPVHHGLVGDFEVPAPYYPAVEADAQQARQLAGLERARPVWRVEGDEGIAFVELEPTTASGSLSLRLHFRDEQAVRDQRVEAWLEPGQRPWTIVGLAEGTIGYAKLKGHVEPLEDKDDGLFADGRVALYAKGRILGKWLMTLAYDSDKKEEESRFGGTIDPTVYYTVYADRSERRHDAASVRKLYLKLERPQFYALFGDFETGVDEPELARYVRSFNGVKGEYRSDRLAAMAFAADAPNRYGRIEIQGNGLSGPYALGARDIIANSERVTLEVRDQLRSDRIVDRKILVRHIDYDIDYLSGTVRMREPILSRDSNQNPQFLVIEYEVDGTAGRSLNAGGRVAWRSADQKLQVAATAIQDKDDRNRTLIGGADIRFRPNASTEIRAEVAVSDSKATSGAPSATEGTAHAWLVEAEHHSNRFDLLAYAREQQSGFGTGQQNGSETGTRKFGFDGRVRLGESWALSGSAWHEDYLANDARRIAGRALIEYHGTGISGRAGITIADDRLEDGRVATSQILQLGATKTLIGNKLELDAQTEIPLGGKNESIDFPARHRLSARYAVSRDVHLVGSYEIADGEQIDARTARVGFDLTPWAGARIAASANAQNIAEYGPRSFASFGFAQSVVLSKHWSVDLSLDSNKTLDGFDPARVLNPAHPVSSGGYVGSGDLLTEDFTALTAGATYRSDRWSIAGRAEYRAGDRDDRYGVTAAALRQIGEGGALGAAFNWFTANSNNGAQTRTANLQLSWAHRPADSSLSWLNKLELREDSVKGAVAGLPAPIGGPLSVTGDARSRRAVNSLSVNWTPRSGAAEVSLFWGSRYVSDSYGADDVKGWSNILGVDARIKLTGMFDIGAAGSMRAGTGAKAVAYSGGPSLGIRPFDNGWIVAGWNIKGYRDRDFDDARYTRSGPYVTMRVKFDQLSLQAIGLGRR
jgi:uncharacterized repeat protein (TIGR01451 family)